MEAVIVPVDDYEKMAEALDLLEHMEIHRLVTQRARKKGEKTVPLEALLKEQRLAV
jgi:PHD/YefM family antitoxin component YafN of YafNO toxin-antitoxin module